MASASWSSSVKSLHSAIVLLTSFQLATSLVMSDPGTQQVFPWHQYGGMASLVAILIFFSNSYADYDLGRLFPWRGEGRRIALAEFKELLRGRLPPPGRRIGLSSLIHGLGMLAMMGCALTGWRIFHMVPPGHVGLAEDPESFTRWVLMHKLFARALWAYLAGHVVLAILHQLRGEPILRGIFWFSGSTDEASNGERQPKSEK